MSKQPIILRHPSSNRRQPLLRHQPTSSSLSAGRTRRFAEVAGGTAADCAAVCCCCPCGLVNLLVLAVYKVPAGICRRALRRRRRDRRKIGGVLPPPPPPRDETAAAMAIAAQIHPLGCGGSGDGDKEVEALEKEMWERFYGTGFWRSPSQREVPLHLQEQVS